MIKIKIKNRKIKINNNNYKTKTNKIIKTIFNKFNKIFKIKIKKSVILMIVRRICL